MTDVQPVQLEYANRDGTPLLAQLYQSARDGVASPALVAVHGGGWKIGSPNEFRYWGPWLARHGITLLSIDYRLVKDGRNRYPAAVQDVVAAIRFARANAADLRIDPTRIGLMGASAGAHLAALAALAGNVPTFRSSFRHDNGSDADASVKVAVCIYGVYNLAAQWEFELSSRPNDNLVENFLGMSLPDDRLRYFEASPISHAIKKANGVSFLLSWGTEDEVVDGQHQSKPFFTALRQAGCFARIVPVAGGSHYYNSVPIDEPGSIMAFVAPNILRFLNERL